jgi:hypothetical protein
MDSKECGCRSDQLRGLARISLRANSVYSFDDDLKRVPDGVGVGRIFMSQSAPKHRPWMWTSNEHNGRPPAFGYEETREAAMAAFAKLAAGYTESRCGD